MVEEAIAIIPARGGSKRIKKKNILDFFGKPLIAWTIDAAIKSELFQKVLVSTEDEEIAEISVKLGAEVPFLRKDYADDFSEVSKATIFSLNQAEEYWKQDFPIVVQLMPNCPNRNEDDIKKSFETFILKKRVLQQSCFKFGWMNPWWAIHLEGDEVYRRLFPKESMMRSQDLPNLYCPSGAIWIANSSKLKLDQTFHSKDLSFEELDWMAAIDIDDETDLEMAKAARMLLMD